MTFAEYTKKRKQEEAQVSASSPRTSEKPKSFAEYTRQKKGITAWRDEEQGITRPQSTATQKPTVSTKSSTTGTSESGNPTTSPYSYDPSDNPAIPPYARDPRKFLEDRGITDSTDVEKYADERGYVFPDGVWTEDEWRNNGGAYGSYENYLALTVVIMEAVFRSESAHAEVPTSYNTEVNNAYTSITSDMSEAETADREVKEAERKVAIATAKVNSFGQRPSGDEVKAWQQAIAEKVSATKELEEAKRKKAAYDNIEKYSDDVNQEKDISEDLGFWGKQGAYWNNFISQWSANYRLRRLSDEAGIAASAYADNPTEENRAIAFAYQGLLKSYMQNNEKALDDEGQVLPLLSDNYASQVAQMVGSADTAVPYGLVGGGIGLLGDLASHGVTKGNLAKAGWTAGYSIGSGVHSYDVIRGSLFMELLSYGVDEETARELAADDAVIEAMIESGETAKDMAFMLFTSGKAMPAKATGKMAKAAAKFAEKPLRTLGLNIGNGMVANAFSEGVEEGAQASVSRATREKAFAMMADEIGQYGEGNIDLYNRPIVMYADGSVSAVDSVIYEINGKYVMLPTIVRDENGNAKRLNTAEEILSHYEKTGEYFGKFDTQEEAYDYANRLHNAMAYKYSENTTVDADDSILIGGAKVLGDAFFGGNDEALKEIGESSWEGAKGGFVSGGVHGTARTIVSSYATAKSVKKQNEIADSIIADEEALDALIEEGKASGEGTVSAKLAEEIEQTKENGETVTREQVKKLIASNEVYIQEEEKVEAKSAPDTLEQAARDVVEARNRKGTSLAKRLETQSQNNEPITVAEVKKATGYGDSGSVLVTSLANRDGSTFKQAKRAVETAYNAGLTGVDSSQANFVTDIQKLAFEAGVEDKRVHDLARKDAKVVIHKESGFSTENLPADVTKGEAETVDALFKAVGIRGQIKSGLKGNAEIVRETGEILIDPTFEREVGRVGNKRKVSIVYHAAHEAALHRVIDLAPEEGLAFMYDLYRHLAGNEPANFTLADQKRHAYAKQGVNLSLSGAMEEVTANNILYLYGNNEAKFKKAIESIANGTNTKAKQGLRHYIEILSDIIRKLGEIIHGKSAQERAQIQRDINELRRLRDEFETVLSKAVENRKALQDGNSNTNSTGNLEIKTNEEYNGDTSHSLKTKYDEYTSLGMQWAYNSHTKIGDRKVLYKPRTDEFVLVEATKEDVGFIEIRTVSNEQLRKDERIYESNKEKQSAKDKRAVDTEIHNFEVGQNYNTRSDGDAGYGRKGIQNAGVSKGESRSNGTTNTQASDGNLKKNFSLKDSDGNTLTEAEQYTEKEYCSFGWARANNILNEGQNADYRSKFAMAKSGQVKFPKSKSGEYIIPVSDIYDSTFEGINNVLVFAKGNITNPIITTVIEIYEYDETSLDIVRRNVYELERRGIQQKVGGVIRRYYADDFGVQHYREYLENSRNNNDNEIGTRDSGETSSVEREEVNKSFSLKNEYWHTDLTKSQVKEVEKCLRQEGNPKRTRITRASNWYKGRIGGRDLFVIYTGNATILYEVKGEKAKIELDILKDLLEDEENGKSINGKPSFTQRVSKGSWMQNVNNSQNNLTNLGRGQNNRNAGVLQRQSQRNGSRAFWNVLENLFRKQEQDGSLNEDKSYSLKEQAPNKIGEDNNTLDLTNNTDLSARVENQKGSKKYKIIRDYILETLGEGPIVLSDGIAAKVDRSDALHLANKSADRKVAYIAKIKTIIERAKLYAIDSQVEHKKFDEFRYYQANVKYGDEVYPVYLNVGRSKNGDGYHIYDITKKIGATVKQKYALERVKNDLRSETDSPISNKIISQPSNSVKKKFSLKGVETVSPSEWKGFVGAVEDVQRGKKGADERLAKYVDSGIISTELYDELIEEYGAIPSGEKPHREIQVPKKTGKNKKVSQTVRTILEAKATPDEAIPTIEKMVEDGIFSYDAYSDKHAISDAESYIRDYGWDESLDDWFNAVEKGEVSKQITTLGWALYNNAANIAATTTSETEKTTAIKTSLKILDAMVRHQRSAAQALQATRILKQLSPETQLYGVQKSVQALQKELTDKYGDKAPNLKIDEELAEQFISARTSEERAAIEKEIYKDIGRQMPSRFIDKWNAWRYLAMLGNVRTHIRNIVGNAGFAPIVIAKDLTAATIESVVYRVSGKKTVRGKSIITGNKADRALLKAAWSDYGNVADMISNGGKYNDSALANQQIEEGRQIFKFKPLEWARKKNSALLEAEDMWFSKPHYAYALAQYCKANNITAEQIKNGRAIAPARAYAIKEAQKATYRDTNAFSQFISELGRSENKKNLVTKGASIVLEGTLPFRKTPANILVRGVEYSPLGLLKGLSYDLYQVSKGKMSASEAIDNISAGLTGTGLLALGILLAAQGLIRGHGEDDKEEKEFKEMMGHQSYSLELPNGKSITLDWLAPEALTFFVGVNIWETTRGTDGEVNLSTILQAVSGISEPMLEMSCLQSLNDLFESVGYATSNDTSGLVSVLSSAVTSYLTQVIPTLSGQAERTGEENRMTTYTEKNGFLTDDMQYTLGKVSAKIPFWDYNQIPYIDAWGRKEASGAALKRGFNNFLNPAYTSTIETSKMEEELLRLYESTGESGVFPTRADKYFTVDGVRKDLTADEYVRYATLKGEKSYKLVSDLVKSKAYKKLSDSEKAKAVKEAYDYANQKAKQAISNYKPETWVNKADDFGSNIGSYISFKTEVSGKKEENGGKISKQEVVDIILDMAQNDSETWKMYLSMYDSDKDMYAYNQGIDGETYMYFLESLNDVDGPTASGKYGTYTQKEAERAINNLRGLSRQEKAILWQSVNTSWKAKNNPFR